MRNQPGLILAVIAALLLANQRTQAADSRSPATAAPQTLSDFADLPLDQITKIPIETVSGASRYTQKVTEAPASVSIVTSDEIKRLGFRTLAEVLQSVSGLYVTSDRNYSYLGIRGFQRPGDYNTRVLLLVDGHRLNDNVYNQALLGTEALLDVDLIERVEVIRGPGSSIYGDNAFLGVVNVTTRRGGELNGVEASLEAGSWDTYKGRFTAGGKLTNEVELLFSGSWYDSAGHDRLYYQEFDSRTNNFGIAQSSDADRYQTYFGSVSWRDLSLTSGWLMREKQIPTASFGAAFNTGRQETTDDRGYVNLQLDHLFNEDTRVTARASYDIYSYEGDTPYDGALSPFSPHGFTPVVMNYDKGLGEWITTGAQLNHRLFDKHNLIFGAEYRDNFKQEQRNRYADPALPSVHIERSSWNFGSYGQAEVHLLNPLTLDCGLRYDYYDTFGSTVNPRLGLIYTPWPETAFKALYGQAFRAPNSYELDYEMTGINAANPNLDPETIRTYELVYEQYLPAHLRLSLSAYYNDIHDLISQEIDSVGQLYFANLDHVEAKGVEFEIEHKAASGLLGRLSYAFQRAENSTLDQELTNSPRHQAKLGLIIPLWGDRVFSGVELLGSSGVHTLAGEHTDPYVIANWTLFTQRLVEGLETSVTVYNLFDTHYSYPGSDDLRQDTIEQDGIGFRLKVTYKF